MAWPQRGAGLVAGVTSVHDEPSHSQESAWLPLLKSMPPNRKTLPCAPSYTSAWNLLPEGPAAGVTSVHDKPSHCQVSERRIPAAPPSPPNRTVRLLVAS